MTTRIQAFTSAIAASLVIAAHSITAQTIWDGDTDPNNSGDWTTGANWSTGAVPVATANVELNDVTTGARTVTLNSVSNTTVATLSLTQTTTTATNTFNLQSALILTGATAFNTTLGVGVAPANLVTTLSGDGRIILSATSGDVSMVNRGTFNLTNAPASGNGSGFISRNQIVSGNLLEFQNLGTLNLQSASGAGINDGGALIGSFGTAERAYNVTLSNTGTVNVTNMVTIGTVNTAGGTTLSAASARVINSGSGVISINDGGTLQVRGRSSGARTRTVEVTNAQNATINVGETDGAATGGTLLMRHTTGGQTPTGTPTTPRFENNGTLNIRGTSVVEFTGSFYNNFEFENNATGIVNLNHNSRIGNTDKNLLLTNEGTINKTGSGTASIESDASGSFDNSGTVHVHGGTLVVSTAITNSGNIRGNGTLTTAGITSTGGTFAAGNSIGTLTLNLADTTQAIDFESPTTFTFELNAPNGTPGISNDLIAFSGLNSLEDGSAVSFANNVVNFVNVGSLGVGLYTLFSFDQASAYSGLLTIGTGLESFAGSYFSYNDSNIQLNVVPEPGTAALVLLGTLTLWLPRRRKA